MKQLFILLILLGYQFCTLGQNPNQNANGKSINTYWETEIEGSPFIPQDWGNGKFIDGSNKSFDNVSLRYNAYSQLIEYKQNDIVYNPNGLVKTASIEKNGVLYSFRAGFAAIDKQTEQSLYEVLYDGKNKILKYNVAKLTDKTSYADATSKKRVQIFEYTYFVKPDGTILSLKINKKQLLALFPEKATEIENFLTEKKIKNIKLEEMKTVLNWLEGI